MNLYVLLTGDIIIFTAFILVGLYFGHKGQRSSEFTKTLNRVRENKKSGFVSLRLASSGLMEPLWADVVGVGNDGKIVLTKGIKFYYSYIGDSGRISSPDNFYPNLSEAAQATACIVMGMHNAGIIAEWKKDDLLRMLDEAFRAGEE